MAISTISSTATHPTEAQDGNEEPERKACLAMEHGFHIRHPPSPHNLNTFITDDSLLFQTIHMGRPVVDSNLWRLRIHGLVDHPFSLNLSELQNLPSVTITSFHECYGSPLKPPIEAVRRIGNVRWTGVRLKDLLEKAEPLPEAAYVWSDGLDRGSFGGVTTDRYQKDLPLAKALSSECLVAFAINGRPLDEERGGPVRLVVPGWFGTNSTKWLCSLKLERERSLGPFTTRFYNELIPGKECEGTMRPVWDVEPNSILVSPQPDGRFMAGEAIEIWGWAWSGDGIRAVDVSMDGGTDWSAASVVERKEYEWQRFELSLDLKPGLHDIIARATSWGGLEQPMTGRRNHMHRVTVKVVEAMDERDRARSQNA